MNTRDTTGLADRLADVMRIPVWMVDTTRPVPLWAKIPGVRWIVYWVRYR